MTMESFTEHLESAVTIWVRLKLTAVEANESITDQSQAPIHHNIIVSIPVLPLDPAATASIQHLVCMTSKANVPL